APQGACPCCLLALALDSPTPGSAEFSTVNGGNAASGIDEATLPHPRTVVLPRQFAQYELVEEVGRGGMGGAFKARQRGTDRFVAVKVLKAGAGFEDSHHERFFQEARTLAQLRHSNIVQIFEVSEEAGCPYFSMEFMEGGSLARRLRGLVLPLQAAAEIVATLADAVAAAHQAGVLHRDLKPGNVLLHPRPGEHEPGSLAGFEIKVADFGLARPIEHQEGRTPSGAIVGTPSYMAPEQARGRRDVGPVADGYALGA